MLYVVQGTAVKIFADFANEETGLPAVPDEVIATVSRPGLSPRINRLTEGNVAADDDVPGRYFCIVDTRSCEHGKWDYQFAVLAGDESSIVGRSRFTVRPALAFALYADTATGSLGEFVSGSSSEFLGYVDSGTGAMELLGESFFGSVAIDAMEGVMVLSGSATDSYSGPPLLLVAPFIEDANPIPGITLTADHGTWSGTGTLSYEYQWVRCSADGSSGVDIAGAEDVDYDIVEADVDHTLRVRVTATDDIGPSSQTSAQTDLVHFPSQNIFIDPSFGSSANTNWSTFSQNAAFFFGGTTASTTAQNSSITLPFYAEAGVYTLDLLLVNSSNRGVYTIAIDGIEIETQIDGYSAATTVPRATIANVQILTSGTHDITFLMATKNPASSGYEGALSAVTLTRAGDLVA